MTASGNPAIKLTYEDYLYLPEDGRRHEIIDGEHHVTPAPTTRHQQIVTRLTRLLESVVSDRDLGVVLVAPTDVVLSDTDVVQPDLLFVSRKRARMVTEANIDGAPDLVIEVTSPKTRRRDEITKRDLYAKHGVTEYWIVDPEAKVIEVYHATEVGSELTAQVAAERGEHLTSSLLPNLEIRLDELFG
jgi:Uma2 family endonuclease